MELAGSLAEAVAAGSDAFAKLQAQLPALPATQGSFRAPPTYADAQLLVQELAEREEKKRKQRERESKSKKPGVVTETTFDKTGAVIGAGKETSAFWLLVEVRAGAAPDRPAAARALTRDPPPAQDYFRDVNQEDLKVLLPLHSSLDADPALQAPPLGRRFDAAHPPLLAKAIAAARSSGAPRGGDEPLEVRRRLASKQGRSSARPPLGGAELSCSARRLLLPPPFPKQRPHTPSSRPYPRTAAPQQQPGRWAGRRAGRPAEPPAGRLQRRGAAAALLPHGGPAGRGR
jgi:hypothetical protein